MLADFPVLNPRDRFMLEKYVKAETVRQQKQQERRELQRQQELHRARLAKNTQQVQSIEDELRSIWNKRQEERLARLKKQEQDRTEEKLWLYRKVVRDSKQQATKLHHRTVRHHVRPSLLPALTNLRHNLSLEKPPANLGKPTRHTSKTPTPYIR